LLQSGRNFSGRQIQSLSDSQSTGSLCLEKLYQSGFMKLLQNICFLQQLLFFGYKQDQGLSLLRHSVSSLQVFDVKQEITGDFL